MKREEAWIILNLQEGTAPEAVEATFLRRNAELAQRIAEAPTPAVRAVFEQQAARLHKARELVMQQGDAAPASSPFSVTRERDLPALRPSVTGPAQANGQIGAQSPRGKDHLSDRAPLTQTQQGDLPVARPHVTAAGGGPAPDPAPSGSALGVATGQVLGNRYEVRAHVGSGGMGQVFAAFDRVRQEELAIKVLLPHLLAEPQARERFLNEARIASSLSHPGIVRVFDVHQTGGLTFLTMELLKGHGLREEMTRRANSTVTVLGWVLAAA
jgi:hypothetical protein